MNSKIRLNFYHSLFRTNINKGFTLIELLVVIIILGILSVVALPNFLRQAGKAREAEIKQAISVINRAQQAYHFEKQVFAQGANDGESLGLLLGVGFNNKYIDSYNIISNGINSATLSPTNNEYAQDGTRAYSGGTFYNSGGYRAVICQSPDTAQNITPPVSPTNCGSNERLF